MGSIRVFVLTVCCLYLAAEALYLDSSDPWKRGPLEIEKTLLNRNSSLIPMHTKMYYPVDVDEYAVFYFIGGFDGMFPPEVYGDLMENIASHGYVVAGTWPLLGQDGFNFSYAAHLENVEWLRENVEDEIGMSGNWDFLAYGCHSAGCGSTYEMTKEAPEQVLTNVFYEPVSTAIHAGENCVGAALMLGAKLATGSCSFPGMDHVTYYNYWECPKVLVEAEEFGHCDLLNYPAWQVCNSTGICGGKGPADRLDEYNDFVQGVGTAMMNAFVQGQIHYLDYLLVEEEIPIALSMYETDVECTAVQGRDMK